MEYKTLSDHQLIQVYNKEAVLNFKHLFLGSGGYILSFYINLYWFGFITIVYLLFITYCVGFKYSSKQELEQEITRRNLNQSRERKKKLDYDFNQWFNKNGKRK